MFTSLAASLARIPILLENSMRSTLPIVGHADTFQFMCGTDYFNCLHARRVSSDIEIVIS